MSWGFDAHTPQLTATDSRGLPVRQVAYWRQDLSDPEARLTLQQHDAAGRLVAQRDPRLMADVTSPANLSTTYTLSGQELGSVSVDAGWRASLLGEAQQSLCDWDGRGSERHTEYDDLLRPRAVYEQAIDGDCLCAERYGYGSADPTVAEHNQCGQLIRHEDPAGTHLFEQFGLRGEVLSLTRHFLRTLELPDWPLLEADRDTLLEPGAGATHRRHFNALGEAIEQIDARSNRQFFLYTRAGQLREVRLQLAGETASKTLVSAIQYNAHGQTEREIAGNGVTTTLDYAPEDGRLTHLRSRRSTDMLQDLHYAYDPVGNVHSIKETALPSRYFANQKIEPVNRYSYDSLYQLIKATGWEAGAASQGPRSSVLNEPAAAAPYSQTYRYDRSGNLLELVHQGPQSHGHQLVAAAHSNRCLPVRDGLEPDEVDFRNSFDGNGNLLELQPGQSLSWNTRNQLREVRPVERDAAINDSERYFYGGDGMRVRKVRSTQTNARTLVSEVRYLPGLELRTHSGTGEVLQVISLQAGRNHVRVLHWESEPPKDIANDQHRYSLNDHLGSCALELDSSGDIISQERYHPFGTTAWSAGRAEVEASYKTVRYSGQERDATWLYYYGFRYYVPWLKRWLNPDPAGAVDGLNLYSFAKNNPSSGYDFQGLVYIGSNDDIEKKALAKTTDSAIIYRGDTGKTTAEGVLYFERRNKAFQLAFDLVESTVESLRSGDVYKFRMFYMGDKKIDEEMFRNDVEIALGKYEKTLNYLSRYQKGGDLENQTVFIKNKSQQTKDSAWVYKQDPHRRIFLTQDFMKMNKLGQALVIIHEVTHLAANTVDHFYYHTPFTQGDPRAIDANRLSQLMKDVEKIHSERSKGPNGAEFYAAQQMQNADTLATYPLFEINSALSKRQSKQPRN